MTDDSEKITFDKSQFASNFFTNTVDFIDRHIRIFKYSSYAVAAVGVVVILRSTHAFRQFGRISAIPPEFVEKQVQLRGSVQSVDDQGIIHLIHIPIFKVPFKKIPTPSSLPVSVASVELSDGGVSWLQRTLTGQKVWFRLLASEEEHVRCIVTCRKSWFRNMVVNQELVTQGLAAVSHVPSLPANRDSDRLTRRLVAAEIKAEKRGKGIWQKPSLAERLRAVPWQISDGISGYCREKVLSIKTLLGVGKPKMIDNGAENKEVQHEESSDDVKNDTTEDIPAARGSGTKDETATHENKHS